MYRVSAFYLLRPCPDLEERRADLESFPGLCGSVILAAEGVNATIAGSPEAVQALEDRIRSWPGFEGLYCKHSQCEMKPFGRWKVTIRRQAVTAGDWTPAASSDPSSYLSPAEWHERLQRGNAVLLDVRNDYEVRIGTFPGAVDPRTRNFAELKAFVEGWDLPRDTPLLTFCTGGIRCEKAVPLLMEAGFANVSQLHGGILEYLREFPEGAFEGDCFVFDDRVALDGHLQPCGRWGRCPECGDPVHRDDGICHNPACSR